MQNSDEEIKRRVVSKFFKDKFLKVYNIKTTVVNGIVTLEGTISALWYKVRAETITKPISGVKGIINKLSITLDKSATLKDLKSEQLTQERLIHIVDVHLSKIECYFGLLGTLITIVFIVMAAFLTPNYNPLVNSVSSLGHGIAKTLFSIAFVTGGSLGIPFILYLEKSLVNINEFIRRSATIIAISGSTSIALVGILPDPDYLDLFRAFHAFVAFNAFIGTIICICLYSYLMLKSGEYKKYHVIIGFTTGLELILLLFTLNPLIEWILTINIAAWTILTSIKLIRT
jgi:hypothetical membrane protein